MRKLFSVLLLSLVVLFFSVNISVSQPTWQLVPSGTYENLYSIHFPTVYTGYAVGNAGKLLKTANMGFNWTSMTFPAVTTNYYVFFTSAYTGYVSNQSALYKTINGGYNWNSLILPNPFYTVTGIYFSSANTGWLGNHNGGILKTTDAGSSFTLLATMPGYDTRLFFLNDFMGWAVDNYGYIYRTTNGGINFITQRVSYDTLSEIYFTTSTIGMAVGDSGKVLKTTDGGVSWNLLNSGLFTNLKSVYMTNPYIAYVTGDNGLVMETNDGGDSWYNQNITASNLKKINFPPATSMGWVCGDLGTLAKRSGPQNNVCIGNGTTTTGYPFYTYYMDSRTDMLYLNSEIVGNGGASTGAISQIGFQFDSVSSQVMQDLYIKMQYTTATTLSSFPTSGLTTVWSGYYTVTGQGWQYITLTNPFIYYTGYNLLIEICFNNSSWTANSTVYASNAPGMTFHNHADLPTGNGCTDITTGSVMSLRPNICLVTTVLLNENTPSFKLPISYNLHQNYPNPFNPVTRIEYEIPAKSFVNLKIFDILGREISTLVNKEQNGGAYEVDFNGSGLASGVYFYRLTTEKFTDTKKMVLIR